jgi:hypothetical protein
MTITATISQMMRLPRMATDILLSSRPLSVTRAAL